MARFAHHSALVTASSSCFLPHYTLFFERIIHWVHLVDHEWFFNGGKKNTSSGIALRNNYNLNSFCFVKFTWNYFSWTFFYILTENPWRKLNLAQCVSASKITSFGLAVLKLKLVGQALFKPSNGFIYLDKWPVKPKKMLGVNGDVITGVRCSTWPSF